MRTLDLGLPLLVVERRTDERCDDFVEPLVARARTGDREAFGELLQRHLPAARRVALAAVQRHHDADEAVQEASITAWLRLGSLAADRSFRPWFLRIVWRKALDRRRSVGDWIGRFVMAVGEDDSSVDPPSADVGPEAGLLSGELETAIAKLIRTLPRRLRDPFLLAASGDHRYEEIAALLGVPLGSVKWRVSEARRLIRTQANGLIQLHLTMFYQPLRALQAGDPTQASPTELNQSLSVLLRDGQPLVVSRAADPVTDRRISVEVKAAVLK